MTISSITSGSLSNLETGRAARRGGDGEKHTFTLPRLGNPATELPLKKGVLVFP